MFLRVKISNKEETSGANGKYEDEQKCEEGFDGSAYRSKRSLCNPRLRAWIILKKISKK
jgi:hypothetical protein